MKFPQIKRKTEDPDKPIELFESNNKAFAICGIVLMKFRRFFNKLSLDGFMLYRLILYNIN